jgi:hypothetical protein
MPCNCDYLEPTEKEAKLRRTSQLLEYSLIELGKNVPDYVSRAATSLYCNEERVVADLCGLIEGLSSSGMKKVVYNPYKKESRDLANWWEEHQAADKERIRREKQDKTLKDIKKKLLNKLTKREKQILGL